MAADPTIWGYQAGDVATWAGAGVSALAVIAALGIAVSGGIAKWRERRANALFSASLLYTDGTELVRCLRRLHDAAVALAVTANASLDTPALNEVRASAVDLEAIAKVISRDHAHLLPGEVAADMAMTMGMVAHLGEKVRVIVDKARTQQTISTDFARSAAENSMIGIENMRSYFRYCERKFKADSHKKFL